MQREIDQALQGLPIIGPLWKAGKYPLKRAVKYYLHPSNRKSWGPRIADALACEDNRMIPRVPNAGQLQGGYVVMHNGLRIVPESYYGEPMRLLLERNRGVHEPQEERVFMEVLRHLPEEAVMLELGAYWGFYSMWFHQQVRRPGCYLVEPLASSLEAGQQNFAINGMSGHFIKAYAGEKPGTAADGIPIVSVDQLMREKGIERLNILHADIQEAELAMLQGARQALEARRIDYIFISTHSEALHHECRAVLEAAEFVILADADLEETYSLDGLIVGRRRELAGLGPVSIAKKKKKKR